MPRFGSLRRWASRLLAATLASLVVAIVTGYWTRIEIVDAYEWIAHTEEVKVAITGCELALVRGGVDALREAETRVEHLTVDNPRQQKNIARASLLTDQGARDPLEELFVSMQREEDRLMTERLVRATSLRARNSAVFILASSLALIFGAVSFFLLRVHQRHADQQRALLEGIIESVDEGVIALDSSRSVVAINAVARALWAGDAPREEWPEDWRDKLHAFHEDGSAMKPEDGPLARALRGETSVDIVYRIVLVGRDSASTGKWISASARPIRDGLGEQIAAVTTLRDVSAQRALAEKLRDQSLTDELTSLLNRRGFLMLAGARLAEARRARAPLGLLFADVNGLKRINDELGHEQGDRVIADAADAFRSVFRGGDIVARLGGDEFAALLPNLSPESSNALLSRLADAVHSHEQKGRPFRLSMSYGVTFMDWNADTSLDELLADADRKMYESKRSRSSQSPDR